MTRWHFRSFGDLISCGRQSQKECLDRSPNTLPRVILCRVTKSQRLQWGTLRQIFKRDTFRPYPFVVLQPFLQVSMVLNVCNFKSLSPVTPAWQESGPGVYGRLISWLTGLVDPDCSMRHFYNFTTQRAGHVVSFAGLAALPSKKSTKMSVALAHLATLCTLHSFY